MTEVLTSKMIKDLVRKLEAASAKHTKACPDCGGEPWGEDEWSRLYTVCANYLIRVGGHSEIYDEDAPHD